MKINEILTEQQHGGIGSLIAGVKRAMPNTVDFPKLKSQDPYKQLRMGMALASAMSPHPMDVESAFGENMTLVGYTNADMEIIKLAMKILGKDYTGDMEKLSTDESEEAPDVNFTSPIAKPKRNKFGV
jgi:hypothetical protein